MGESGLLQGSLYTTAVDVAGYALTSANNVLAGRLSTMWSCEDGVDMTLGSDGGSEREIVE